MEGGSVFLEGVALASYRGIGPDTQKIGPFRRFNFLIGPNNAGKSGVINFISRHLAPHVLNVSRHTPIDQSDALDRFDVHLGVAGTKPTMGIGVSKDHVRERVFRTYPTVGQDLRLGKAVRTLLDHFSDDFGIIWMARRGPEFAWTLIEHDIAPKAISHLIPDTEWRDLCWSGTNQSGGGINEHWIPGAINKILNSAHVGLPKIGLIPAIREISSKGSEFKDWTGVGLIDELARHQNPSVTERHFLKKFERINGFLQAVTCSSDARIEIPHDREHVLVHIDEKVLPLSSLGTGIHEVVMLAAFCTFMEKQIVCIEEPEIHLHPLLQRRLIRYLEEFTNNQYFVATHSASIIDSAEAAIFHVTQDSGRTHVRPAITASTKFDICRDLGYKASDLLQANAIIWVEGPSDRIYLRHWIEALDPSLREGIEYSIMFYGGRLLSHLSAAADDPLEGDIKALIAVRQINRNMAVVIDSDKANASADINTTKQRIKDELEQHGGVPWITAGREIENYVPNDLMTTALESTYKNFAKRSKVGQFDHVLPFKNQQGEVLREVDKVRIARAVCEHPANFDVLDLRDRVAAVVELIREANK